jgi:hypothetical protein
VLQNFDKRFVRYALFSESHHLGYMVADKDLEVRPPFPFHHTARRHIACFDCRHDGVIVGSISNDDD